MIEQKIKEIQENIQKICKNIGRNAENVKIIAVSKTKPVEMIDSVKNCGVIEFGENKVQELCAKYDKVSNVKWHLIGHLQTNKVKYLAKNRVQLIQSVDSFHLAEAINKMAFENKFIQDVLLEVNIGREENKSGVFEEDLESLVCQVSTLQNIRVCGLMTVAPKVENKEDVRPYFRRMKKLFDKLKNCNFANVSMKYLSMGMSGDYDVAIEEGSNMVRIGSGIFGEREYLQK